MLRRWRLLAQKYVGILLLSLVIAWPRVAIADAGCGGSYALKVEARQTELLDVYAKAIERGQEKEVFSKLDNCLEQVAKVFQKRVSIKWPSLDDVYEAAKAVLMQAAEKVCQAALASVKREEQEWISVWESAVSLGRSQKNRATDWQLIWRQSAIGNRTLSSVVTNRLRDILR